MPSDGRTASGLTTFLYWPEEDPLRESERCNGCGHCRTETPAWQEISPGHFVGCHRAQDLTLAGVE